MPISFSDLGGGGGGGGGPQVLKITAGSLMVPKIFEPGIYIFRAQSDTSTEIGGVLNLAGADQSVITQVSLVDSMNTSSNSVFVGSLNLTVQADYLRFTGNNTNGWLEIYYYPPYTDVVRVVELTTTTADYVLPFNAKAHIFGGGGGGAGHGTFTTYQGGGGGGSGFLTKASVAAGTYSVVIGAGGSAGGPGGAGGAGGGSSFGSTNATGGSGGLPSGSGGLGGAGGSGGGGGSSGWGPGGIDGANGGGVSGGSGSGVAIANFATRPSLNNPSQNQPGIFYAGGSGGASARSNGVSAAANSASGGGGASADGANTPGWSGGNGGSGIVILVEEF